MNAGKKGLSVSLFFAFLFLFCAISFAYAVSDYKESYKILKEAHGKGVDLGPEMNREKIKMVLLSAREKDNIPFLLKTLKSDPSTTARTRAFITLVQIGSDEYDNELRLALDDKKLKSGLLLVEMAKADARKYRNIILEQYGKIKADRPLSQDFVEAVEALSLINNRKTKEELTGYFKQALADPDLVKNHLKALVAIKSLYRARDVFKYDNTCRDLLRKFMDSGEPSLAVPAACVLYFYDRPSEVRKYFKINNPNFPAGGGFDKYDYYFVINDKTSRDLGRYLLKQGIKSKDISPDMKIKYLEFLAKEQDGEARDVLIDMAKNREKHFEKALWILAVYYNDPWVKDKLPKLFKDHSYWTPEKQKEREYLLQAYLVTSDKRSVELFKRWLSDVSLLKKEYACQGLRHVNARGTKPEMKSLFSKMDYKNPSHQPVSFHCARAMNRFGVRHYIKKLLKSGDYPNPAFKRGLESLAVFGDQDDLEMLKYMRDKLPPELYDPYLKALTQIAGQQTVVLTAAGQGKQDEPLRDSRLLMKDIFKNGDPEFKRKAAGYIEPFTYHWQSIILLKDCVQSKDSRMKINGILAFRNATDPTTIDKALHVISRCLTDSDFKVKTATATVYVLLKNRQK